MDDTTLMDPQVAVSQYIAGGMTSAAGMPNLYQLRALFAASAALRYAWGRAVADAFDAQLSPPALPADAPANATLVVDTQTVDDIGGPLPLTPGIRPEAAQYLEMVSQGFPYVGRWRWTKEPSEDVPPLESPRIVTVTSPGVPTTPTPTPAVVGISTSHGFFTVVGADIHAAIERAFAWIEEFKQMARARL